MEGYKGILVILAVIAAMAASASLAVIVLRQSDEPVVENGQGKNGGGNEKPPPPKEGDEDDNDLPPEESVPVFAELPAGLRHIPRATVKVCAKGKSGELDATFSASGLIVDRPPHVFCWTSAYLVSSLRHEEKANVRWEPAEVVFGKDGPTILADVIRYDENRYGPALLRLRVRPLFMEPFQNVGFDDGGRGFPGETVYHVSAFEPFTTKGLVRRVNVTACGRTCDVTSQVCEVGSMGGGVFIAPSRCIGMVMTMRTYSPLVLPLREWRKWAQEKSVLWALDASVPMPSDEELRKLPIE